MITTVRVISLQIQLLVIFLVFQESAPGVIRAVHVVIDEVSSTSLQLSNEYRPQLLKVGLR